ncbi:GNAT family N-acetyltransferase [Rufibacter sp. LB8]|uniref:GNAT family N-acetyltransferase n=1 Tax=Rufibacter sp. LB8 TaxID=2777781 RepID=UPI00178C3C58|nr:GNAT family N-acetyltransferase [Rufibacter sp. LB8]
MTEFLRTNATHPDFTELVMLLDADLHVRDGDDHSFYAQFNKLHAIRHVVLAYVKGQPVGCGAIKEFTDDSVVEVKRMFVLPEFRNRGVAHKLLIELERWAAELGYKELVLETGKAQPEAIRLYTKSGFHIIPNYGQYQNIDNSVCMKKKLNKLPENVEA